MTDEHYAYWYAALDAVRKRLPTPNVQDGYPQCGYYRIYTEQQWLPVAIFIEDVNGLVVYVNGEPIGVQAHHHTWLNCARRPVSYEDYSARIENGSWLGVMLGGDNTLGDDVKLPVEDVLVRVLDAAQVWLSETEINSDSLADECGNRAGEIYRLRALVTEKHETEKAPHLAKCREIDDKYLPLIRPESKTQPPGRATIAIQFLRSKITMWDNHKTAQAMKAAADEAAKAAELQKKQDEATAIARAEAQKKGQIPPPAPPPVAAPAPPPPPTKSSYGGLSGNRISPKSPKMVAVITDQDACYQHFKDNPKLKEVLQKLSQAMVTAKQAVPGVEARPETP